MSKKTDAAGMSRTELDKRESKDFALGPGPKRPRDAATLILLDRSGPKVRVLMGRRSQKHAFMPGRLVFPGGRTDRDDGRVVTGNEMLPEVAMKLQAARSKPLSDSRVRAIVLSAVRETYEEAGLLIGSPGDYFCRSAAWQAFADNNVVPSLENLRIIARAITPPGRVRRFDTYFIAAWRESVAVALPDGGPTHELEELVWLPMAEAMEQNVPLITKSVLQDLQARLVADPDLSPGYSIPFYRMRHGKFLRDLI
jgi:8-oxo-dGTP pyrophosphatase MutT (NUDIX family)